MRIRALQRFFTFFILSLLATALAARADLPGSFLEAVRGSGLIFRGTVRAVGRSTPTVPAETRTAVVVVERIVERDPGLGNVTGQEVTVRFREAAKLQAGQSAVFFTRIYSAGTSLGLDEVGWLPATEAEGVDAKVGEARAALADEALARRLESAELVVVGVVGVVGRLRPTEEAGQIPGSEHDPLWWQAPIRVDSVEKGNMPGSLATAVACFAGSIDILWQQAPRLHEGESAIFLLQPGRDPRFPAPGLVDPLDVLSREQLDRVRRLLPRQAARRSK
jgi:hypothetical protein